MSKLSLRRVLFIAGVIVGLVSAANADTPFCSSQTELVDHYLGPLQSVGAMIVTLKLGEQPCYMWRGEAVLRSGKAPNVNTIFELASVTKVFTTAILAMHQRQQYLYVWGPVKPYLPPGYVLQPAEETVTFQQLATFTGGFWWDQPPDYTQGKSLSQKDFVDDVNSLFPKNPIEGELELPTKNYYSNGSIGFLGQILMHMDSSTTQPYPFNSTGFSNWISTNLTGPLNMPNTAVEPAGDRAIGYDGSNQPQPPFPWEPWGAAGALRSNAADMLKFLKANICAHHATDPDCAGIPKNVLDALETAHLPNEYYPAGTRSDPIIYISKASGVEQAWAWRYLAPPVPNPNNVTPIISKNGGHPGFSTLIAFNPNTSYGLVILMNTGKVSLTKAGIAIIQNTP